MLYPIRADRAAITILAGAALGFGVLNCGIVSGLNDFEMTSASSSSASSTTSTTTSGGEGGGITTTTGPGGNGGQGGASGQGGAGGAPCTPGPLNDDGLVARYKITEMDGEADMAPSTLQDSGPEPIDLDVETQSISGNTDPTMKAETEHWGLEWDFPLGNQTDSCARAAITDFPNSKFIQRLNGKTAVTLELVVRLMEVHPTDGSMLLSIGSQTPNGDPLERLSLLAHSATGVSFLWDSPVNGVNTIAGAWKIDSSMRSVLHLVLDTNRTNARILLYADGQLAQADDSVTVTPPEAGAVTDLMGMTTETRLTLGNRVTGGRPIKGVLYYAALYNTAFNTQRVEAHVCTLRASDDNP